MATLIVLTIGVAILSKYILIAKPVIYILLILSGVKFLIVAFQFMELKKAAMFWKVIVSGYLILFMSIVMLLV